MKALVIAVIVGGIVGLLFTWLDIRARLRQSDAPELNDGSDG